MIAAHDKNKKLANLLLEAGAELNLYNKLNMVNMEKQLLLMYF